MPPVGGNPPAGPVVVITTATVVDVADDRLVRGSARRTRHFVTGSCQACTRCSTRPARWCSFQRTSTASTSTIASRVDSCTGIGDTRRDWTDQTDGTDECGGREQVSRTRRDQTDEIVTLNPLRETSCGFKIPPRARPSSRCLVPLRRRPRIRCVRAAHSRLRLC